MTLHGSGGLEPAVQAVLAKVGAPGCTVAVVTASGPVWAGSFGLADARSRRPATTETVYHLFSGTKLFTATAVVRLEEEGLLSLADPLTRHLPGIRGAEGITLHHLLTHQSGLQDTLRAFLAASFPPQAPPTTAVALSRYRIRSRRPPGTRVQYRNVNFALLGEVVSRVSGMEYREFVAEKILGPLGMGCSFRMTEEMQPEVAIGYMRRWDPMRPVLRWLLPEVSRNLYRHRIGSLVGLEDFDLDTSSIGGLVGAMPEFGKFLQAQLSGGGGILTPESTRRMQTLAAEGAVGVESRVGVGLGWKVGRVAGRAYLNHEGGGPGFTSELRLYPEAGTGIALAMNLMRTPKTYHAAHKICEAVFALYASPEGAAAGEART